MYFTCKLYCKLIKSLANKVGPVNILSNIKMLKTVFLLFKTAKSVYIHNFNYFTGTFHNINALSWHLEIHIIVGLVDISRYNLLGTYNFCVTVAD